MTRRAIATIGVLAFWLAAGTSPAGQSPPVQATPEWMTPYLPVTAEDKARAAFYDSHGAWTLEPGKGTFTTACGISFGFDTPPPPYYDYVAQTVCTSDVVVVGTAQPGAVRMNNKRTYLFTEFRIAVSRWLQPPERSQRSIDVLMAGGKIETPEGAVSVSISGMRYLEPGTQYLLFLKHVPGTRAFTTSGFVTPGANWARLLGDQLPYELRDDEVPFDRFVDDLENAAARCRAKNSPASGTR